MDQVSRALMAVGGSAATSAVYVDDVFSTYLYTGNGSTQTINNGIDLAGKGGMVWIKGRTTNPPTIFDTERGVQKGLVTAGASATDPQYTSATTLTAFSSTGFTLGSESTLNSGLASGYVSWTFREQAKFFDVVTYTGNNASRSIAHNLGSVPAVIIVKNTSGGGENWQVYHSSLGLNSRLILNSALASENVGVTPNFWGSGHTSTTFSLGSWNENNTSGNNYVAYLFASDAGGFGLTGADSVVSCGIYTSPTTGNTTTVNLGWEPQWILFKGLYSGSSWTLFDTMRGLNALGSDAMIFANSTGAEVAVSNAYAINPTGFSVPTGMYSEGEQVIYIAIRRPMKTPTSGTSVFAPYVTTSVAATASGSTSASALYSTGFVTDMVLQRNKDGTDGWYLGSRHTATAYMKTETSAQETTSSAMRWDSNVGVWNYNASYGVFAFRRAPRFFDVVCYTGDSAASRTVNHNLGAAPELMIVKSRSAASTDWAVYSASLGATKNLFLNTNDCQQNGGWMWNNTAPTSSAFSVSALYGNITNNGGDKYVAYLFATCPGVSKVGTYAGDSTSGRVIDCGFAGGARFVLIKQVNNVTGSGGLGNGNWYVWDAARGIVAASDPNLSINNSAAELTNTDAIDATSTGFIVNNVAVGGSGDNTGGYINQSGYTYIFLAIA